MKRYTLFFVIFVFLAAFNCQAEIALVKTGGAFFSEAQNGFSSVCFEKNREFLLADDLSNSDQLAAELKSGNFQLVLAIGLKAASFVKQTLSTVPLVYCLVVNPENHELEGQNITGVSLTVPFREQFILLKTVNKDFRRLGVIYTSPTSDKLVEEGRKIAEEEGFTLVKYPITSAQDIQKAMNDMTGKIDALWIPPDPSLSSDEITRYIGQTVLSKQLPCIGPTDRYARSGAIFSVTADAIEAGKMCGELANKILQGTSPSKITAQKMERRKVIINLKAAGLLGLTIPRNILDGASKIYE